MSEKHEPLICEFKGYLVRGASLLLNWDGGIGTIEMNESFVENEDEILDAINDAGFGCQEILAAKIHILKEYDYGAKVFWKNMLVNLKEPGKPVPEKYVDLLEMEV